MSIERFFVIFLNKRHLIRLEPWLKTGTSDKNKTSLSVKFSVSSRDVSTSRPQHQNNTSIHSQTALCQCISGRGVLQSTDLPTQFYNTLKAQTVTNTCALRSVAMVSVVVVPNNLHVWTIMEVILKLSVMSTTFHFCLPHFWPIFFWFFSLFLCQSSDKNIIF